MREVVTIKRRSYPEPGSINIVGYWAWSFKILRHVLQVSAGRSLDGGGWNIGRPVGCCRFGQESDTFAENDQRPLRRSSGDVRSNRRLHLFHSGQRNRRLPSTSGGISRTAGHHCCRRRCRYRRHFAQRSEVIRLDVQLPVSGLC